MANNLHELMHALGFEHENQRHDAPVVHKDVFENPQDNLDIGIYDPFSIMAIPN